MTLGRINFIFIALIFSSACYGLMVEMISNTQALLLFIGLHFSALGAILAMTLPNLNGLLSANRLSLYILLLIFSFRIAFFPVMVIAASVACYSEWLMYNFAIDLPIKIFPALFISVGIIFAVICYLILQAVNGTGIAIVVLIILALPALLISFSSKVDFTLLPDNNWNSIKNLPQVTYPQQNPYISELKNPAMNPAKKLIALAGAVLYPLIPNAPWAQASKGILEQSYIKNPNGSSKDRLKDHYAAFIAAFNETYSVSRVLDVK